MLKWRRRSDDYEGIGKPDAEYAGYRTASGGQDAQAGILNDR